MAETIDLSAIYKEHKLYKVTQPILQEDRTPLSIPEGFNGVAVLYEYEASAELDTDRMAFLSKVIEAGMKLNPAQVLKANLSFSDVSLQKLFEQANAKTVIVFSSAWLDTLINANIQKNEIVKLYGMKVMATDTLDVINTSDAAKKAFWLELKKLF